MNEVTGKEESGEGVIQYYSMEIIDDDDDDDEEYSSFPNIGLSTVLSNRKKEL